MNEQLFEQLWNGGHFIVLDVDERISVFYFKLAEAIEIKNRNPFINIKYNKMSTISQLFK